VGTEARHTARRKPRCATAARGEVNPPRFGVRGAMALPGVRRPFLKSAQCRSSPTEGPVKVQVSALIGRAL
jgi:hypothetical protein